MIEAQACKWLNLTPPAAIVDNASLTVTEIDTLGWDYLEVLVILGASDIAMTALALTESDTSGSGHANITGCVFGTSTNTAGSTSVLPSATDDNDIFIFQVDLRKRKRYIDLTATCGNGTAGTYVVVLARLSRGEIQPVTAAGQGANQILRV